MQDLGDTFIEVLFSFYLKTPFPFSPSSASPFISYRRLTLAPFFFSFFASFPFLSISLPHSNQIIPLSLFRQLHYYFVIQILLVAFFSERWQPMLFGGGQEGGRRAGKLYPTVFALLHQTPQNSMQAILNNPCCTTLKYVMSCSSFSFLIFIFNSISAEVFLHVPLFNVNVSTSEEVHESSHAVMHPRTA